LHSPSKIILKLENFMFKNPTNHGLFGPWANELCAHLQKKLLKKLETMAFWAHGLTNVQPISKKQDYKNF
jgi:hypothetical protein